MKKENIGSMHGAYTVFTGADLIRNAGRILAKPGLLPKGLVRGRTRVLVVTQPAVKKLYASVLLRSLKKAGFVPQILVLPDGERAKSQKELFRIYQTLLDDHFDRSDVLLALGGGVTGDVCGFAAATYLRGLAFVNIATTLLAQVDSAVGGKTAINLDEGKNLIGTFYPARVVLADTGALKTLPERDFKASLAEVVKYGVIRDADLFMLLEKKADKILARDKKLLAEIVSRCVAIKARVAERDERETKGERMILNYGHTFGHAFEKAARYTGLLHGEAVSIGMAAAGRLAVLLNLWPEKSAERQEVLMQRLGLPLHLKGRQFEVAVLMKAMQHDKKRSAGRLRFVLPVKIGKVIVREDVPPALLEKILKDRGGR